MVYLLVVSFILHFISFYIMILLYQRQSKQEPVKGEKVLREMEDMLVSYTTEMKENNDRIVRIILKERKESAYKEVPFHAKLNGENERSKDDVTEIESKGKNNIEDEDDLYTNYSNYKPFLPKEILEPTTSDTAKVLSLHKRGLTVKEIAQKLNMGAGEVELMIKFHK
ncbi:DUF6115 domain-containing protein [Evansella sp. AB-rgal1]|uniref:DUF6115 domain-containing protein n=1 Tax=Evansella sp. AB-rgal1 TaxID=3242696 RepID=UPI00359E8D15